MVLQVGSICGDSRQVVELRGLRPPKATTCFLQQWAIISLTDDTYIAPPPSQVSSMARPPAQEPARSSSSGSRSGPAPTPAFLSLILKTHNPRLPVPAASPLQAADGPSKQPLPLYLPPPAMPEVEEDLVPPENFAVVTTGVYRSGFPKKRNFRFMETLKLRTIL